MSTAESVEPLLFRNIENYVTLLMCACMLSCFSCVQLAVTPWTAAHQAPLSMGLSRHTGMSCQSLLRGIFPNSHHLRFLQCRRILYHRAAGEAPTLIIVNSFLSSDYSGAPPPTTSRHSCSQKLSVSPGPITASSIPKSHHCSDFG